MGLVVKCCGFCTFLLLTYFSFFNTITTKFLYSFKKKGFWFIMASSTKKRKQPVYVTIIGIAIIAILAIAIISVIALSLSFKDKNSAPSIFGYSLYIMDGAQMEPEIPKGSAIFAKTGPISAGDPIGVAALCKVDGGSNTTVMRIVNTEVDSNGLLTYWVRFDTQPENTAQIISASSVIGQAKFYSKGLGKFITFAVSPIGILCLIIVPCVMFAVYQVLLIILKQNTDVSGKKEKFFLPEDVEIDEDARDEYRDTSVDDFAPVSNADMYQKPTAKERKAQQDREMAQLARGFGTQVLGTNHEIHRTPAEKKADTLDDVLFAAKKSNRPSPIPQKPQMSATEKYGLDKDDDDLSFVRKASTPVSDTKYDDVKKQTATPVRVKVKPKVVAVKPKVTEKSIEIEKITAVTEATPSENYSDDIKASFEAAKAAREAKLAQAENTAEVQTSAQEAAQTVAEVREDTQAEIAKAITPQVEEVKKPAEPEIKIPAKSSNQKLEELMALLNMQNEKNKQ